MNSVELFIKEKGVNISEMERKLGLPQKSLKIDRGLPRKHLDVIIGYLKDNYEYSDSDPIVDVDIPVESEKVVKRVWNKNFIPDYKDGIERFQSEDGLWRRYKDECVSVDKGTGEIKYSVGYKPVTGGMVYEDKFGKYWLCENGVKVYKFEKK
jgi:hypothetical protein